MKNESRPKLVVVISGCPKNVVGKICQTLLHEKLVGCISTMPVSSSYAWKGKIESAKEVLLIIKTLKSKLPKLEKRLHEIHPYEVPEFVVLESAGVSKEYLAWLCGCVG